MSMSMEMYSRLDKVTNPGVHLPCSQQIETGRWLPSRLINMEIHQSEIEFDTIALGPQRACSVRKEQNYLVAEYEDCLVWSHLANLPILPKMILVDKINCLSVNALWGNNRNSCFHKLTRPSKCVTFNVQYIHIIEIKI